MVDTTVVHRLYAAFEAGDGAAMAACYAPDATFRDEVFDLHGRDEIGGMWQMLLARGGDLAVAVERIDDHGGTATARWSADYTFSQTRRRVHNEIEAEFVVEDDLIVEHHDRFDFWKWSRQALGPVGVVAGWTPLVRGKVQAEARRGLDTWLRRGR